MSKNWKSSLDRWLTSPPEDPWEDNPVCEGCEEEDCNEPCDELKQWWEAEARQIDEMYENMAEGLAQAEAEEMEYWDRMAREQEEAMQMEEGNPYEEEVEPYD